MQTNLFSTPLPHNLRVGDQVGCERWPCSSAHPGCWLPPHTGVILEVDDPSVWEGSLAFPFHKPSRDEVRAHVDRCQARGLLLDEVPVSWAFGKVLWEKKAKLRPVAVDCAEWEAAREAARRR